jgi:hypothetical protein
MPKGKPKINYSMVPPTAIEETRVITPMDLFALLEERRLEAQNQQDILHKRIGALRDELNKELGQSHREIMTEIKELKVDQKIHANEMSDRVSKLEEWKWQAAGGILVLIFILPLLKEFLGL